MEQHDNDEKIRQQTSATDATSDRGSEARYQPDRGDQVALGQQNPATPPTDEEAI